MNKHTTPAHPWNLRDWTAGFRNRHKCRRVPSRQRTPGRVRRFEQRRQEQIGKLQQQIEKWAAGGRGKDE